MSTNPYQRPEFPDPSPGPSVTSMLVSWVLKPLAVLFVIGMVVTLLLPAQRRVKEASKATQCRNQLKNIALALHNYESQYGSLPPAYTVDATGKPLHSWRTLILPYMEERKIYDMVDFSKPWDDPANQKAREELEAHPFWGARCPSVQLPPGHTVYLGVVTDRSCLRVGKPLKIDDVADSCALTLAIVEVDAAQSVHWMSPLDANGATIRRLAGVEMHHPGRIQAAFLDGTVQALEQQLSASRLEAMITIDGHDDDLAMDGAPARP